MAALWNKAGHYIFELWFISSFFLSFLSSPQRLQIGCPPYFNTWCGLSANLECSLQCAARGSLEMQDGKNRQKFAVWAPSHNVTIAQLCRAISSQLRHYRQSEENLLNSNISPTCLHNMVNFGLLAAEIVSLVWGTSANFNGFRVLAALLHDTVVGVSQTLQR